MTVSAELGTRYVSSAHALGFLPWLAALPLRLRRLRARLLMVNSSDRAEADGLPRARLGHSLIGGGWYTFGQEVKFPVVRVARRGLFHGKIASVEI